MTDLPEKTDLPEVGRPPLSLAWRILAAFLIIGGALAYYGSYWHYWFNPHDEGGTVCLVAQRLMAGERPWVDVEPGYNIGWFYPVVCLFHFTGVSYLAARAWFFALATVTALLGCATVTRLSGSRWLGLAIGWLLVVLPGSQFKDYIPLAAAANMAALIFLTRVNPASPARWFSSVILGGIVLGLTCLVRVEIGMFFLAIWIGAFVLLLWDRRAPRSHRVVCVLGGVVCLAGGVLIPQTPAYLYCRSIGVQSQFVAVYVNWARFLEHSLNTRHSVKGLAAATGSLDLKTAATNAADSAPPASPSAASPAETTDSSTLHREPLSGMWRASGRNRLLPFLTYAPLLSFALFILLGVAGLARAIWRREFTLASPPMQWLLLIGGSLTTFPQFFFFRPDRPHLSEFMPGFFIAMAGSVWLLWPREGAARKLRRAVVWLCTGFLAVHLTAFAFFALEHPSAGTIAARKNRKTRFDAENGVHVFATRHEAQILSGVRDAVLQHSRPNDYLVCFPYMPGYNLMTNRRTYVRNVYVDNATRSNRWSDDVIRDFETKRPAVVIIDDRKINGLDASRFSRWAAKTYAYLKQNYTRVGRFDDNNIEVFALPSAPLPDSPSTP